MTYEVDASLKKPYLSIWNQKISSEKIQKLNLTRKLKKFRIEYLLPTFFIDPNFINSIYTKQINNGSSQSKKEIIEDF